MRATIGGVAAAMMVGASLLAAPAASVGGMSVCEVVTMPQPASSRGGIVMDLEQVPGAGIVYAGSVTLPAMAGGSGERPVVWYGRDRQPRRVGPRGMDGVVQELRPTGLISGMSVDAAGREYAWVQHVRSNRVTIVETGTTERFWVDHINDRGAAAGSVWVSDFDIEARLWWRVDRPGLVLPHDGEGAIAYDLTNDRRVSGAIGIGDFRYQAVIWDRRGVPTELAGNPGSLVNSTARLINERGEAAGFAMWGDQFTGHLEAARWRTPAQLESLGLLPDGGDSMAHGQSEGGWIVGYADHSSPDDPEPQLGPISHATLWTDEVGHARVLPSPYAVEQGIDDWRQWLSPGAHAVHTGLDQAGGSAQSAVPGDPFRSDPVVWVHASSCGERLPTTHTAYWEQPGADASTARPGGTIEELPDGR